MADSDENDDAGDPKENRQQQSAAKANPSSYDLAITNATKNVLTSICTVFDLFFDENYQNDYHVSLEKVMRLKNVEPKRRAAVSGLLFVRTRAHGGRVGRVFVSAVDK